MRERIMFRFWNKNEKQMWEAQDFIDNDYHLLANTRIHHSFMGDADLSEEFVLMQYTGLKDKNGKDIYEGDIVKINDDLIELVMWVDQTNWLGVCGVNGFVNHEAIYKKKPEIVGNIHENPELLKETTND